MVPSLSAFIGWSTWYVGLCAAICCEGLVILVCLVEFRSWHGVDKFRDIVCVLCIECAGMILRHVVNDECRHLLGVVHACSVVEGVWSPYGGPRLGGRPPHRTPAPRGTEPQ